MYFWRIEQLKQRLTTTALTDREVLPYFVIFLSLISALWFIPASTQNVWDHATTGVSTLLSVFGTIWLYQRNGGAAGHHFLQRYFAVGWVVAVRWAAAVVLLSGGFYSTLYALDILAETMSWQETAFFALAEIVLYWRIGFHIHDLANRTAAAYATQDPDMKRK